MNTASKETQMADMCRQHGEALQRIGSALGLPAGADVHTQCVPAIMALREALLFYAAGNHFTVHDTNAWDTVSGEPANFHEDEANTATVEDGSIAKMALAATPAPEALTDAQVDRAAPQASGDAAMPDDTPLETGEGDAR